MANVLNAVIPCECKDIFIHNKSERNYYTLSRFLINLILFLNTLSRKIVIRELWSHIVGDRSLSSKKSAFFVQNTPRTVTTVKKTPLESGTRIVENGIGKF